MGGLEVLLLAVAALVVAQPLADRLDVPYPVLLTVVGVGLGFVPQAHPLVGQPELILPILLPPLLYKAAGHTSLTHLRRQVAPILTLAVALVVVSALVAAVVLRALLPGTPWSLALAVGAACAPPDPVAATSVAGRLGLPHQVVAVIQGEGLVNDAVALTLLRVTVAAAVAGGTVSWSSSARDFALSVVGGVAVGVGIAWIAGQVLRRLPDPVIRGVISAALPYGAFVAAEIATVSGVLAVLTLRLVLQRFSYTILDVETRTTGRSFWQTLDLLLTSVAFVLIGLELHLVLHEGANVLGRRLVVGLAVCAALILLRMVWLLLGGVLSARWSPRGERAPADWRQATVMGWAGMRGVVTVAAVLSIPRGVHDHGTLIVVGFVVVVGTLVLPGLTLPALTRRLRVGGARREVAVYAIATQVTAAMLDRVDELRADQAIDEAQGVRLRGICRDLAGSLGVTDMDDPRLRRDMAQAREGANLRSELLAAAQGEALRLRQDEAVDPAAVDEVLRRIDEVLLAFG